MRTSIFITLCWAAAASALYTPRDLAAAPSGAIKYYDVMTGFNFTQYTAQNINYRIAVPSNATKATPYDVVLQIVAPLTSCGWAGFAWGGGMTYQPLTIVWANGQNPVVSSRVATGYSMPTAYAGATYTTLPTSSVNSTHVRLDLLCSGCSQWTGQNNVVTQLDPSSTSVTFAYARSGNEVATPSSKTSSFGMHTAKGTFSFNLASAKDVNFDVALAGARNATHTS